MNEVIIKIFNTRKLRRSPVLEKMTELNAAGKSCLNCSGVCCTSIANSMQIDLVQAVDFYLYLIRRNLFDEAELLQNIKEYRLEVLSTGKGTQTFRKNYTCPYYAGGQLGCKISKNSKPYGCLAFNPIGEGVLAGENCRSYQQTLIERESKSGDDETNLNEELSQTFGLINDSQPIPIKLLEVHRSFSKQKDFLAAILIEIND